MIKISQLKKAESAYLKALVATIKSSKELDATGFTGTAQEISAAKIVYGDILHLLRMNESDLETAYDLNAALNPGIKVPLFHNYLYELNKTISNLIKGKKMTAEEYLELQDQLGLLSKELYKAEEKLEEARVDLDKAGLLIYGNNFKMSDRVIWTVNDHVTPEECEELNNRVCEATSEYYDVEYEYSKLNHMIDCAIEDANSK